MTVKRSQINASVTGVCKGELEAILEHHFKSGKFRMSMTKILEELIHQEAKRLKLDTPESASA